MFKKINMGFPFLISFLFASSVVFAALVGCQPKVTISDLSTVSPGGRVEVNKGIGVAVKIDPPDAPHITYNWIATRGKVKAASLSAPAGTYEAPATPGMETITVEVLSRGKVQDRTSIQIEVVANVAAADLSEGVGTTASGPTGGTAPPTAVDSSKYGFESGGMGWRRQTHQGDQAVTTVAHTTEKAYRGAGALKLTLDLKGGHPNDSKGEALVELRPPAKDLQGKTITAWIYAPTGSAGNSDRPNGVQVFVKDPAFKGLYGDWINLIEENWFEVSLTVNTTKPVDGFIDNGFDPRQIQMIGIKVAIGDGSKETYAGPIYVDAVDW